MSAHALPQTFIAKIEGSPERLSAAVATIQFVHVTTFDGSLPGAREHATRHAEESLWRDIYQTGKRREQLARIEWDLRANTRDPMDCERIRKAFEKIREFETPELQEARRHEVSKPVQSLRFVTGTVLSVQQLGNERHEARVHIDVVPVFDKKP